MYMDQSIWSRLPDELINRICCEEVKSRGTHPFAEEIKTLNMFYNIVDLYEDFYGVPDAYDWLNIDLEAQFPDTKSLNWGNQRKWKSLTPNQRRDFFTVFL